MTKTLSIKTLYHLALAEGEGVGTAYEYVAKRLVLLPMVDGPNKISRILIAGLPEKYGSSLDFIHLAAELGATVLVVDDRQSALSKLAESITKAREAGWFSNVQINVLKVSELHTLEAIEGRFDLCLSSEVIQRIVPTQRQDFVNELQARADRLAIFTPNADNPAHTKISGLNGLHLGELAGLLVGNHARSGYLDMPPFPPGITRNDDQRSQATEGRLEGLAMRGLDFYVRFERFVPKAIRRRQSHITYAYASIWR